MKKILFQSEYLAVLLILVLSFFPWIGLLNQSGMDVSVSVIKNITSVASITDYAISITVLFATLALVLALLRKANSLLPTISFGAAVLAFVFGMIDTSGDYLSSMELAYLMVVLVGIVMLLRKFGLIKKF